MNLAIPLALPQEVEQEFLQMSETEQQDVLTTLLMDWADKKIRKKRREERLKNLHPIVKEFAGFLKKPNGESYTDEELDQMKYDYLQEKYGYK